MFREKHIFPIKGVEIRVFDDCAPMDQYETIMAQPDWRQLKAEFVK
jgi:hypothetical protein